VALRLGQFGARQAQSPQSLHQLVSHGRAVEPDLIAAQPGRAGAISKQHHLFLESVFHVPTGAVQLLIQALGPPAGRGGEGGFLRAQRGDHVAWIGPFLQVFCFGDHPAGSRPTVSGLIDELGEDSRRFSGLLKLALGQQACILRQAYYIVHSMRFAPGQ
jgi:hypothetical protein